MKQEQNTEMGLGSKQVAPSITVERVSLKKAATIVMAQVITDLVKDCNESADDINTLNDEMGFLKKQKAGVRSLYLEADEKNEALNQRIVELETIIDTLNKKSLKKKKRKK